jgi:hypothetical protein
MKWWIRGNNKLNIHGTAKNESCSLGEMNTVLINEEFNNSKKCKQINKHMIQTINIFIHSNSRRYPLHIIQMHKELIGNGHSLRGNHF